MNDGAPKDLPEDSASDAAPALVRRRRKKPVDKRGIALVMVLGTITILTVFLTELQTDSAATMASALAERDRLRAEYYAKSAVSLSRMLLAAEKPVRLQIGPILQMMLGARKLPQIPVWEFSDMVLGAFNGGDRQSAFGTGLKVDIATGKNLGLPGNGYFDVAIIDEDSKISLNAAAFNSAGNSGVWFPIIQDLNALFSQPQYATLFEERDGHDQFVDAPTLCANLYDWVDGNEELTNCLDATKPGSGSEDNVYQQLGLDYRRKNAAFDSLDEVRLVSGVDDDRWATFFDPDPSDPRKRVITVWGQGAINVNTANPQTLLVGICSLAQAGTPMCTDPVQAQTFLSIVGLLRQFTRGVPLFASGVQFVRTMEGKGLIGPMLAGFGLQPVVLDPTRTGGSKRQQTRAIRKVFTAESKVFSIYAEGVVPGLNREARVRIHAVVDMRQALTAEAIQQAVDPNAAAAADANLPAQPSLDDSEDAPVGDEFVKELQSNPFGSVVYYRID